MENVKEILNNMVTYAVNENSSEEEKIATLKFLKIALDKSRKNYETETHKECVGLFVNLAKNHHYYDVAAANQVKEAGVDMLLMNVPENDTLRKQVFSAVEEIGKDNGDITLSVLKKLENQSSLDALELAHKLSLNVVNSAGESRSSSYDRDPFENRDKVGVQAAKTISSIGINSGENINKATAVGYLSYLVLDRNVEKLPETTKAAIRNAPKLLKGNQTQTNDWLRDLSDLHSSQKLSTSEFVGFIGNVADSATTDAVGYTVTSMLYDSKSKFMPAELNKVLSIQLAKCEGNQDILTHTVKNLRNVPSSGDSSDLSQRKPADLAKVVIANIPEFANSGADRKQCFDVLSCLRDNDNNYDIFKAVKNFKEVDSLYIDMMDKAISSESYNYDKDNLVKMFKELGNTEGNTEQKNEAHARVLAKSVEHIERLKLDSCYKDLEKAIGGAAKEIAKAAPEESRSHQIAIRIAGKYTYDEPVIAVNSSEKPQHKTKIGSFISSIRNRSK